MFSVGILELIIIFVVILLVIGPEKLPKMSRTLAKHVGDFRRVSDDLKRTVMSIGDDLNLKNKNDPNLVKRLNNSLLKQFEEDHQKDSENFSENISKNK